MDNRTRTLLRRGIHISSFRDRHGKVRYRFRKKGLPGGYFSAPKGSRYFALEYEAFLRGERIDRFPREKKTRVWTRKGQNPERVYFIAAGRGRAPIKIGISRSPRARLAELQVGHPEQLDLLASVIGDPNLEKHYHEMFADLHIRGEWFRRSAEMMREIRRIRRLPLSNLGFSGRHYCGESYAKT